MYEVCARVWVSAADPSSGFLPRRWHCADTAQDTRPMTRKMTVPTQNGPELLAYVIRTQYQHYTSTALRCTTHTDTALERREGREAEKRGEEERRREREREQGESAQEREGAGRQTGCRVVGDGRGVSGCGWGSGWEAQAETAAAESSEGGG